MPVIGGLYTGLTYFSIPGTAPGAADDFLETLVNTNQQDSVVSIFLMPTKLFTKSDEPSSHRFTITKPQQLGGTNAGWTYVPRNKKLLTYPYLFFSIDTLNDSHVYRYEFFHSGSKMTFQVIASMTPNPEIAVQPVAYNGSSGPNPTEQVTMTGFPQVAWPIDTYMAWLAQKATGTALSIASQAVGGIASAMTGNIAGVAGAALGIASTVNNAVVEATAGNKTRGNQSGSVNTAAGQQSVWYRGMSITEEYARMIDDFFDIRGYSVGRVMIPPRANRKQWTYVQTRGCKVFGNIPEDARIRIQEIHDAGVTYWRNPDNVGNYALDNTV